MYTLKFEIIFDAGDQSDLLAKAALLFPRNFIRSAEKPSRIKGFRIQNINGIISIVYFPMLQV